MTTKVVVAMSGGVDSSAAAILLKQQGYEVIGMMLRLWSESGREASNRCCTPDSMAQARHVAALLDIPFYVLDAKDIFHGTVVNYFLEVYAEGGTPNPCLICNRKIRWGFLFDHALALGAEFMATGHYARRITGDDGRMRLLRAVDHAKDQSYVLHVLDQEKLKHTLFPLGEYSKFAVRQLVGAQGLPSASRPDSQDLCFLAGDNYRNFLIRNAPAALKPGVIMRRDGKLLGHHNGLANYTIGQRKGLGVASPVALYVISKDTAHNVLVVGTLDELGDDELAVHDVNWLAGDVPQGAFQAQVKTRYTAREAEALVTPINGRQAKVRFDAPQRDITTGQSAVFYIGDEVIGGGIIV